MRGGQLVVELLGLDGSVVCRGWRSVADGARPWRG
jgi:hypothetical protein